jgi:hypothetical protein
MKELMTEGVIVLAATVTELAALVRLLARIGVTESWPDIRKILPPRL